MSLYNTVLIIGATSGIGAGLTRRLHTQGKKVIATGRREDRLAALQAELPGLETSYFDLSDIQGLPQAIQALTSKYPDIDTVIVAAGVQPYFAFNNPDPKYASVSNITQAVHTNITGPIVLGTLFVPFFMSKPERPTSIVLISSALAFVPVTKVGVYCATKSAIHSYAVSLRAETKGSAIKVVELAPPYVETELDVSFKDKMIEDYGGPDKMPKPMALDAFLDQALEGLESGKTEVGVGFGSLVFNTWRAAFGPILQQFRVDG